MTQTPAYTVVESDGPFEVREYPSLDLVATPMSPEDRGMDGAFGRLFRFIAGGNREGRKIAMTTPVIIEGTRDAPGTMSFILPREDAPAPSDASVKLRTQAGGRFAALRFGGGRGAENERTAIGRLNVLMEARGLRAEGEPLFAYYDPPWTPVLLRRNEVMVRLR